MNTALAISSLHQAAVPSSALARSVAFYRDLLGLRLIAQFSPPGLAFDQEPHAIHRDDDGTCGEPGATEWMAFFRDPDGNLLALASRVAPERSP